MVSAAFVGTQEHTNAKSLLFKLTFAGNYGINGVGDLLSLLPGAITDSNYGYNQPIAQVPENIGVFSENLGGYYIQLTPNAAPSLTNLGIRMFAPGGGELASNAAYAAAVLAGSATIIVELPLQ